MQIYLFCHYLYIIECKFSFLFTSFLVHFNPFDRGLYFPHSRIHTLENKKYICRIYNKEPTMNSQTYEPSASGYLTNGFEGIDHYFTNIEVVLQTEHNILAKAQRYGRWWMLKAIKTEENQQTVFQQILRKELEILMRLQHPNIIQINGMEFVERLGTCLVMEYVDGMRLDEWLSRKPNKEKRLRLTKELLKTIEYIHLAGIVHRDLKPSNIMVTRNGENIKLIDFGLADNDHMAILKQPAGTPKYMSPEQASNNIPDIRNDIYSLGIILQLLQHEKSFKTIIRKCILPINKRYSNVTQILVAIQNKTKTKKRLATYFIAMIIAILFAGTFIQTWRIRKMENKRYRIENAIKEGTRKVDIAFQLAGVDERLDTCTNYNYISDDIQKHFMDGSHAANHYIDSIRTYFSDIEMYEISNAIHMHNGSRLKIWNEKTEPLLNKLIKKP